MKPGGSPRGLKQSIMEWAGTALTNRGIAEQVGTTEQVVKNYFRGIYDESGVENRRQLIIQILQKAP